MITLLDELNSLLSSPQQYHIVAYVPSSEMATILADTVHDFAYQTDFNPGLYVKQAGAWEPVSASIAFDFIATTIGRDPPTGYIGIEHDGVIDNTWPPPITSGNIFVGPDWPTLLPQLTAKKGEIAVINDQPYILAVEPANQPVNWVKLNLAAATVGAWWAKASPAIDKEGVMEVGQFIDFHNDKSGSQDYTYRLNNYAIDSLLASGDFVANTLKSHATSSTLGGSVVLAHGGNTDLVTDPSYWAWSVVNVSDCALVFDDVNTTDDPALVISSTGTAGEYAITINGDVNVTGALSSVGNITTISNNLVQGDYTINGNGTISLDLSIGQNTDITGNLTVGGDFDLAGAFSVSNGQANISGDLVVSADINGYQNLSITGDASIGQNTTMYGDLSVSGNISGNGNLVDSLNADNISTGTVDIARLPVGQMSWEIAAGNHNHNSDYQQLSEKGAPNGYCPLDTNALIDAQYLPAFIDQIEEHATLAAFPTTGVTSRIYVETNTNKTYRWSGTQYVYITSGAVDMVAGKTGVVILDKTDVGLDQVNNTSDLDKPLSTATITALADKAELSGAAFTADISTSGTFTAYVNVVAQGNILANGSVSDGLGNVRNFVLSPVFAPYTITTSDVGKTINTSHNVTIAPNTMDVGDIVTIYNDSDNTIVLNTIGMLYMYVAGKPGTKANITIAPRGFATLRFVKTLEVIVSGNVL